MNEEQQDNQQTNNKKPLNKKFLIFLGIVLAIIIIVIIIVSSVDKCNGTKVSDEINYINDKVNSKSLQYEVKEVGNYNTLGVLDGLYYYKTENNFIVINLSVTNTSGKQTKFNLEYVSLHKNNVSYRYHDSSYFLNGRDFAKEITISASFTRTITIAFETPTQHTQEDYYLYVKGSSSTPNQQILLRTRTGGYGEPPYDDYSSGGYY